MSAEMSADSSAQLLCKFFGDKDIAKSYSFAERLTRPSAEALIRQAGLTPDSAVNRFEVLDNACGTGIVTAALGEAFKGNETKLKILCGDISESMIESVKRRIAQMNGLDAEARILNAQAMDLPSSQFTHVLTTFGFQNFTESILGLQEAVRVTKPGGVVGMTNWVSSGWEPAFRLAVSRVPGAPASLPDPLPYIIRSGRWLEVAWTREQLQAIPEIDPESINIQHFSFTMKMEKEEDVQAFLGPFKGLLDIFTTQWSEEERNACGEGRLAQAMVQAIKEDPVWEWKSLVTTAYKRL